MADVDMGQVPYWWDCAEAKCFGLVVVVESFYGVSNSHDSPGWLVIDGLPLSPTIRITLDEVTTISLRIVGERGETIWPLFAHMNGHVSAKAVP